MDPTRRLATSRNLNVGACSGSLTSRAAHPTSWMHRCLPAPASAATVVLLATYPFALLAHYRFIFAGGRTGVRGPSERGEVLVIRAGSLLSFAIFGWALYLHAA